MNPHIANDRNHQRRIDQVLRRIGSAVPPKGMEDRITAQLARERSTTYLAASGGSVLFGIPRLAFGVAAGALACFGIVMGSVHHSHSMQPVLPGIGIHTSSDGMGSADAARPADRPVSAPPSGRPRSVNRLPKGRAVISTPSPKPGGVAVPKTPATQP